MKLDPATIEACAKVADREAADWETHGRTKDDKLTQVACRQFAKTCRDIAVGIRALSAAPAVAREPEATLADELEEIAMRFHAGWHEGIEIDASDLMTLEKAVERLRAALPAEQAPDVVKLLRRAHDHMELSQEADDIRKEIRRVLEGTAKGESNGE